jgi:N-methylhydantoinase B/oxoprolinase/acetone carboxylase alpha subunit
MGGGGGYGDPGERTQSLREADLRDGLTLHAG